MRKANLLVCVAVLLISFPVYSQTGKERKPEDAIKLSTELVALDVQIIDRKTQRVISGLSQSDFEIYEDGVKQRIEQFSQDNSRCRLCSSWTPVAACGLCWKDSALTPSKLCSR